MSTKWRGNVGEVDRECDGRTYLKEIWKEWEENGEQHQKIEGVGDWLIWCYVRFVVSEVASVAGVSHQVNMVQCQSCGYQK